jgi:hypothetical protein
VADHIYWANEHGSSVAKVAKSGGAVVVLATGQSSPWQVATDGVTAFWVTINGGTLMSVPVGGGSPKTLASGLSSPGAVAVGATDVFWADNTGVLFMPKGGGSQTRISTHPTAYLAVDASFACWTYLAIDAVECGSYPTVAVTTLANVASPSALSLSNGIMYFATGGSVLRIPTSGGTPTAVATDSSGAVTGTFADTSDVYWTNNSGTVRSIRLVGGAAVTRASGQNDPAYVVSKMQPISSETGSQASPPTVTTSTLVPDHRGRKRRTARIQTDLTARSPR